MTFVAMLDATPLITPSFAENPLEKPPPAVSPAFWPTDLDGPSNALSMALPTPFMLGTICTYAWASW